MGQHENIAKVDVGAVTLAYETFGDRADPPVLLIMGLATQMLGWPDEFCSGVAQRDLFVVRFDNRDVGLSTHLDDAPSADVMAALAGDVSSASYTLSEMAGDAAGLLDALGIASAHVVGVSMGGMIAQTMAIERPEHVRSLTSIMSTTGDRSVGTATEAALGVLLAAPATNREEAMERAVTTFRIVGSPGYSLDEAMVRDVAGRSYDRAYDPAGVGRQLLAVLASGDRTRRLGEIRVPTLVIHGAEDPLVDASGGRATAQAVPGAKIVVLEGMGHDLPRELWPAFTDQIVTLVQNAERGGD